MGEYAMDFLQKNSNMELEKEMIKYNEDYTLRSQVNYWLKYIVNTNIKVEDIKGTDIIKASYEMIENKSIRPKNIGSGVSYLISIIIVCLASKPNDLILIENPEIHLHPSSQSKVCEFLYFVSSCNRQIFVETHSDHIFNGIRAGIADKSFAKDKLSINFVNLNDSNCTESTAINIGNHGEILNNNPNLFNQFDIDLDRMLGI
jgi:predicted ATPase